MFLWDRLYWQTKREILADIVAQVFSSVDIGDKKQQKQLECKMIEMFRWIPSQLYLITSMKRTFCPPISSNPIHMSSHPIPISRNPAHLYHIYQVIQYLYQPPISSNPIPMSSHPTPISSHLYQVIQHNHFVTHCHILLSKRSGSFPYKSCIVVWSMTTAVHWFAGT